MVYYLASQRELRGELDLPESGCAGGRLVRDRYCLVRRGGPHDHAPAQDLARAGRARLGTVSAREAVAAMFANNRILLSFREDVLGRARVFPGLKLAEHQMRFTSACRGASGSGEIRSGGGWRLVPRLDGTRRRGSNSEIRRREPADEDSSVARSPSGG